MLTLEQKKQIKKLCDCKCAIDNNFGVYEIIDINYDEKKGWIEDLQIVDPNIFCDSINAVDQLKTIANLKIKYAIHNKTGKKYKINHSGRFFKHNYRNMEEQA